MIYAFEACTLDTDRHELRRAGIVRPLEPHAVDILTYLLQHRDRLVTKDELLKQLWPNRFVGEGILAQRLMTIRRAIGDSGRKQHCIKTVHGRGYRFVAEVSVHSSERRDDAFSSTRVAPELTDHAAEGRSMAPASRAMAPVAPQRLVFPNAQRPQHGESLPLFRSPPHFVGRDRELARLEQWWNDAQQGSRHVAFVVGEPGIGKTALVDEFVTQVADRQDVTLGRGQCVDDYGMGEPYLPVLEALGRLCRDAEESASSPVCASMLRAGSRIYPPHSTRPSEPPVCARLNASPQRRCCGN